MVRVIMGRLVVSQNDRILLLLSEMDRYRDEPEVPLTVSQEGIAQRLDTQVHNASRALSILQAEGLVADRLAHVRGAPKRRRAYFLTEKGRQAALALRSDLEKRLVVLDIAGTVQELPMDEALRKLSAAGMALSFSELTEAARKSDIVRSESLRREPSVRGGTPQYVEVSQGRPKAEQFFGREKELRSISEALDGGGSSVVLLWGIPGIGKSTLASRLFDSWSGKRSMMWYTFREWDTETVFLSALVDFFRKLGRHATADAVLRGRTMAELYGSLLADLSGAHATLFLDDVQKPKGQIGSLLSVLVDAVRNSSTSNMLMISRSIPSFFSKTSPGNLAVELGALDRDAAWQMAKSGKAQDTIRIVSESHGHPLLLSLMIRGGVSESRGDVISFIDREISSSLSPEERSVVELLSVFRHPVPIEALPGDSYRAVSSLRERALISDQEEGIWTHDVIRDFFYSHISADVRASLHRLAARYCETRQPVEWKLETLHHYTEAGDHASAAKIALAHGSELVKEFPEEVLSLVSKLDLSKLSHQERAGVLFLKGQGSERLKRLEEAIHDYETCAALLTSESDAALKASVLEALGRLQTETERWTESFAAHEKALQLYEKEGDRQSLTREYLNIGSAYRRRGDFAKAREAYNNALTICTKDEDRAAQAACLNNLAMLDWDEGKFRDAEMRLKESVRLAHAVRDHLGEAKGLENLASLFRVQSRLSELTNLLWESSEAFRRAGELVEYKRLQAACAESLAHEGKAVDALEMCRASLEKPELKKKRGLFQKGPRYDEGDVALSLAIIDILRDLGEYRDAQREVARLETIAETLGSRSTLAKAKLELAMVHEGSGDLDAALKDLAEAEKLLRTVGDSEGLVAVHMRQGIVEEKRGNLESARERYRQAVRHAELVGDERAIALATENLKSVQKSVG